MRGNRHMFPVPTAMPRAATSKPQREVNVSEARMVGGIYGPAEVLVNM